ncbi:hypothetical protein [Paenibacillus sp. P36]
MFSPRYLLIFLILYPSISDFLPVSVETVADHGQLPRVSFYQLTFPFA